MMEPILRGYFSKFKKEFEIETESKSEKQRQLNEASAFEKFVNYTMFSIDDPDVFIGNNDLLDTICVGGGNDTGIDGIGIRINGRLVQDIDDVKQIITASRKLSVEFVFIQSKMQDKFDSSELNKTGMGIKDFFSENPFLPQNDKVKKLGELKDFIINDEEVISKYASNPSLTFYYVATGIKPDNEYFSGVINIIKDSLKTYYFDNITIELKDGKDLLSYCKELENNFSVTINSNDIIPLTVADNDKIKKAYIFTCGAKEFLSLLKNGSGALRHSLFEENVRDYLGNKSSVNHEIEETIENSPELFLLCNNGITIVCSNFEQIKDKLVKIENPQIVNGCQTSNSLFNFKDSTNIGKVQIVVRVICTDDSEISNKIVRGTNKQNQVLDEAFEATKPFHQYLEDYFKFKQDEPRLWYERRAKQYSSNPLIKKTHIANLRVITQTFTAMFLNMPYKAHRHEAKLLEEFANDKDRKIYCDDHAYAPYYICALTWYMFERKLKDSMYKRFRPYKAHLYLIFRYTIGCFPPPLKKSKSIDKYCERLEAQLGEQNFDEAFPTVIKFFEDIEKEWIKQNKSIYAIKDNKGFSDLLVKRAREKFIDKKDLEGGTEESADTPIEEGEILSFRIKPSKTWFSFIKPMAGGENIYFDAAAYNGEIRKLFPHVKVQFVRDKREVNGKEMYYAKKVRLV